MKWRCFFLPVLVAIGAIPGTSLYISTLDERKNKSEKKEIKGTVNGIWQYV